MSVLACDRRGCTNIMCDRFSSSYGYICDDCFEQLVKSSLTIAEFMSSSKEAEHVADCKLQACEEEFRRIGED